MILLVTIVLVHKWDTLPLYFFNIVNIDAFRNEPAQREREWDENIYILCPRVEIKNSQFISRQCFTNTSSLLVMQSRRFLLHSSLGFFSLSLTLALPSTLVLPNRHFCQAVVFVVVAAIDLCSSLHLKKKKTIYKVDFISGFCVSSIWL